MNVRNQSEFQNIATVLSKKSYVFRSLRRAEFVYSLFVTECRKFDIDKVEAYIEIKIDINMSPETELQETGYVFKGEWYKTGTEEVAKGGSLGNIRFGFAINDKHYCIHDCQISFGNVRSGDTPIAVELGFISDRIRPKILSTLEVLNFLSKENLLSEK